MTEVFDAALEMQAFLSARRWPFCFIGGIAVQRWGEQRSTDDVDLTLLTGFSGEEAFVIRPGSSPTRPLVQVTHDAARQALTGSDRRLLDLASEPDSAPHITQLLLDDVREVTADPREYSERSLTVVTQPVDDTPTGTASRPPTPAPTDPSQG